MSVSSAYRLPGAKASGSAQLRQERRRSGGGGTCRAPPTPRTHTAPIEMPATGALIGTPASMSASDAPQTVAIDDDPSEPVTSDVTRTVYGKASPGGTTVRRARSARAPWPTMRRFAPPTCEE